MHVSVLIFAGGVGKRMNNDLPKQFLLVNNKPIIIHTLEHFEHNNMVNDIVVVCKEEWIDHLQELLHKYYISKVRWVIRGGITGQMSIYNGLKVLVENAEDLDKTIVLIHDGVRPMINDEIINCNIETVLKEGNAITVSPAIETVITVDDRGMVEQTVERGHCYMARAPQGFWLKDIWRAHSDAYCKKIVDYIDSASMMSAYGYKMHTVLGPNENIKITTPIDYYTLKAIMETE